MDDIFSTIKVRTRPRAGPLENESAMLTWTYAFSFSSIAHMHFHMHFSHMHFHMHIHMHFHQIAHMHFHYHMHLFHDFVFTFSQCCNPRTCKFVDGAVCDAGNCCDNCQFVRSGTECRATNNNECELAEYCSGDSAYVS